MARKKTVFVGLSGGVDSSVAAFRLLKAGYSVVGVFIKVWQPEFLRCDWEAERLDAMRVAAHLGIPFLTFDAEAVYKQGVADYLISEYRIGRTPNPDVMCNKHVKFGAFLDFARTKGADAIATGHYARVRENQQGTYELLRGFDTEKDQSYFLWTLTQKELPYILFPVGDTRKQDIRIEAEKAGLPTFAKKDSQGICFLGDIDMKEFLSHYIEERHGDVLDTNGKTIGHHRGALFLTLGERHGFTLNNEYATGTPLYVVDKNVDTNTITVSDEPKVIEHDVMILRETSFTGPLNDTSCSAQFRYRQTPFPVVLTEQGDGYAKLMVDGASIHMPSPGQSCVLYDGDVCLGGGIIT